MKHGMALLSANRRGIAGKDSRFAGTVSWDGGTVERKGKKGNIPEKYRHVYLPYFGWVDD